jgi:hypothetical protein
MRRKRRTKRRKAEMRKGREGGREGGKVGWHLIWWNSLRSFLCRPRASSSSSNSRWRKI